MKKIAILLFFISFLGSCDPQEPEKPEKVSIFKDPELERCFQYNFKYDNNEYYDGELEFIPENYYIVKNLLCINEGIKDLSGIEQFQELIFINIKYNRVKSLELLRNLPNLKSVFFQYNEVETIEPVKDLNLHGQNNCINKEELLDFTEDEMKYSLQDYTRCEKDMDEVLDFTGTEIGRCLMATESTLYEEKINKQILTRVEAKNIFSLDCNDLSLTNIEGLEEFTGAYKILLNNNKLTNLDPLKDYGGRLEWFEINSNNLQNIEGLTDMKSLYYLEMSGNPELEDIEPLSTLERLEKLEANTANIKDLEPLSELIQLKYPTLYEQNCNNCHIHNYGNY